MTEVNICDILKLFWVSGMVLHYCTIRFYKQVHTLILSTSVPVHSPAVPYR